MPDPKPQRRDLRFGSLDEIVPDAEHLLAAGYERAGNWSLGQCCGHLSEWFRYQLDGFPPTPLLLRPVFWVMRKTLGKKAAAMLAGGDGKMRTGMTTIPQSVPAADADDAAAVATLRETIARWRAHPGPLLPSPLLGSLARDEWEGVHKLHAAHHLSFLIPKS